MARRLLPSLVGLFLDSFAAFPAKPASMSSTIAPVAMPPIIFGTAWKKEQTSALVLAALRAGYRGIDTACQPKHYNEAGVGEAIVSSGLLRDAIYLQTKYTPVSGQDPARIPYDKTAPLDVQVKQSVAVSLNNLRTDWIDCLVLHSPLATHRDTMVVWRAMEQALAAGHVRSLGVSNCYDLDTFQRLYDEAKTKPTVLQNRFYRDSGHDTALRAFCAAHGVRYQSFWTLTGNPSAVSSDAVRKVAETHACTPQQVWFAFVGALGIVPLTGSRSEEHLRQDLDLPSLATAEVRELEALLR
mgnify:CR=1 FL=1|jgi:diketogulonate reductase-like aldo/keto reductase